MAAQERAKQAQMKQVSSDPTVAAAPLMQNQSTTTFLPAPEQVTFNANLEKEKMMKALSGIGDATIQKDLMLVMSDLFNQTNGMLVRNPLRDNPVLPLIKLGAEFKKVADFLGRFESVPEISELDHLTVSGDVTFGPGVTLKGTVIIIANEGERIEIPPRALLENKIITGNLRVLDH